MAGMARAHERVEDRQRAAGADQNGVAATGAREGVAGAITIGADVGSNSDGGAVTTE